MNSEITLCSIIYPEKHSEINSLLLAESIRAFGGKLANSPIWFMTPEMDLVLSEKTRQQMKELDVQLIPFQVEPETQEFFFQLELTGLAAAESLAESRTSLLAWMDSNTILLKEPSQFLLPAEIKLAYKPVHHLLLGSKFDQPLDPFWQEIYRHCQVAPKRVFPMQPMVEDVRMRPYFNAGLLVTRPQQGLLRHWFNKFQEFYQLPGVRSFYQEDLRYKIFMHQAILAGVILNQFDQDELLELSEYYNYPAHLWYQDRTARRPENFDQVVTLRHEGFYQVKDWQTKLPLSKNTMEWLSEHLSMIGNNL